MSWWMQLIACFVAAMAFSMLVHQPPRTIWTSSLIGTAGYALFLFSGQSTLGYFLATLFISFSCEICARIMKRTATLFVTGAIIPLVPGVGLYRTMRYVTEGEYSLAVTTGTATLLGLCGIALAITITSIIFSNFRSAAKGKVPPC